MNYKGIIKKQSFIITASIIVMAIILLGTSYALFINKDNSETQVVQSGTLIVSYTGSTITTIGGTDGTGNLLEIEPMDEATVNTLTPYIIKVKNNGTLALKYNIIIYTEEPNTLAHSYYSFKYKNNGTYTQKATLTTLPKVDPSKTNMNEIKYKLTSEPLILNAGEEVTHEMYLWIDEELADETISNKIANIKMAVEGEATDPVPNAVSTINAKASDEDLEYDGTADNNLRYIGANPKNYVRFNNELWRIIGVMNNVETQGGQTQSLLKIRRAQSLGEYSWDSSTDPDGNNGEGINQWGASGAYEGADLMRELNTDYLGSVTVGTNGKWYNGMGNQISANMPVSTLSNESQSLIENVVWKLGSPNNNNSSFDSNWNDSTSGVTASISYTRERANTNGKICSGGSFCNDTVTRTNTWTGKVGLFYSSDYLYATSGGNAANRATCLNKPMYYWNIESCLSNDWLYNGQSQWILSPFTSTECSNSVFAVLSNGNVNNFAAYERIAIYPTVYLKSSVVLTGGEGTQANPYTLQ